MAVSSTDYTTVATALRRCLANGSNLDGYEKRLTLDVIQHAANTLDSNTETATVNTDGDALEALLVTWAAASVTMNTDADALEALLVTHFAILVADGVSPTQAHVDAMVTACATPRTSLIASANADLAAKTAAVTPRATLVTSINAALAAGGTTVTNVTADDSLDGRTT